MKRVLLGFPIFLVALFVGSFLVPKFITMPLDCDRQSAENSTQPIASATAAPPPVSNGVNFVPEFTNLPDFGDAEFSADSGRLIDVFETQSIYRKSEVVAKSGETWLGLYERNGISAIEKAKAKVIKKRTASYSGDEFDVQLKFDRPGVPIFAVRNINMIKPGSVTTLYHRPSTDDIDEEVARESTMENGYSRDFNVSGTIFSLRVAYGLTKTGNEVGVLVLEHEGKSQVIAVTLYVPPDRSIIGNLLWAGDLDNDGQLDLYFDEYNEKGYFGVGLYLSSAGEPGELVKLVATFGMAGC